MFIIAYNSNLLYILPFNCLVIDNSDMDSTDYSSEEERSSTYVS